jgi:multidrug efflux pump subunit AcrB
MIRFDRVASFKVKPGIPDFHHYDRERVVTIEANVDENIISAESVYEAVYKEFDLDRDYPGVSFIKTGEMVETKETMLNLIKTFVFALIGIYFVLILLFNSFIKPFLVILAIPFGITGVIIAFLLHGESMSFFGSLGVIALSGIVVNDTLVLVNHLDKLRKQHPDWKMRKIVTKGTTNRLRPILMTTLTTVAGLLPLVYGWGGTDSWMAPMALAIGYGLLFATFVTLSLIPSLYLIGNDFSSLAGKVFKKKRR